MEYIDHVRQGNNFLLRYRQARKNSEKNTVDLRSEQACPGADGSPRGEGSMGILRRRWLGSSDNEGGHSWGPCR